MRTCSPSQQALRDELRVPVQTKLSNSTDPTQAVDGKSIVSMQAGERPVVSCGSSRGNCNRHDVYAHVVVSTESSFKPSSAERRIGCARIAG